MAKKIENAAREPIVVEFRHVSDPVLGKRTLVQFAVFDVKSGKPQKHPGSANLRASDPVYFAGHITLDEVKRKLKEA